jgi:hypothetical protein
MLADVSLPLPPIWLIRAAVAAVWLYEGVWCKLLGRGPGQLAVVAAVPFLGERWSAHFLRALGALEMVIGSWVLSGWLPGLAAVAQTGLLVGLNTGGIVWARRRIHDPAGMLVKNACFLLLAWTLAVLDRGPP